MLLHGARRRACDVQIVEVDVHIPGDVQSVPDERRLAHDVPQPSLLYAEGGTLDGDISAVYVVPVLDDGDRPLLQPLCVRLAWDGVCVARQSGAHTSYGGTRAGPVQHVSLFRMWYQ